MQLRLEELDISLRKDSNKDNEAEPGISDECLQMSMAILKRKRKNQSNVRQKNQLITCFSISDPLIIIDFVT